jgi:L-threonylcarbamoyladenylate synthase
MHTQIFTKKSLRQAAELIVRGELVAFPTETVYGLGANALNPDAAKKIYEAKGRPSDNPLIVHVANFADIEKIAFIPKEKEADIKKLADAFWPGPMTLILPKKSCIPDTVSGGLETVAVRIPNHPLTLELLRLSWVPIAGPSANISGKPSGTRFSHVFEDFDGKIAGIIKAGSTRFGIESSVIDMSSETPVLLRPGSLSFEEIQSILPHISRKAPSSREEAKSPGMKYQHYTPNAQVILFEYGQEAKIPQYKQNFEKQGKKVRRIFPQKFKHFSKQMFHVLRESDWKGYDVILIKAPAESWVWNAVMNRLRKAASKIIS